MDYEAYIASYNDHDDAATLNRFFAEDVIVDGPDGRHLGRDAFLRVLSFIHDDVDEDLLPQLILRDGNHMMVETDAVFTAKRDRPEFPFKPLVAGEVLKMKFFAVYHLRDGKVAHFKLSCWLPAMRSVD